MPLIASGGAGKVGDFLPAIQAGANAVLAASIFHFQEVTIQEVKKDLASHKVEVRFPA